MKKLKLKEGDLFAVPLLGEKYIVGLMARCTKRALLAYYFNTIYYELPILNTINPSQEKITLVQLVSDLGFRNGGWVRLETTTNFNLNDWPIPKFKLYIDLTDSYHAISYNEQLEEIERTKIDKSEADVLWPAGMAGYKYAENLLIQLIDSTFNNVV